MGGDTVEPGTRLSAGEVAVPRLAATVILCRGGDERLQVLLARRTPAAKFMGGVWVFPGGSVSPQDGDGDAALRAAAVREVSEEVRIELGDPSALVPFSRWITPEEVAIRFDTWFFLAAAPARDQPRVDGSEIVDARWFAPDEALAARDRGEIALVFPTVKQLERLSRFPSTGALLRHARGRTVHPVQPRVVVSTGEQARILLPGDPGYRD